MNTSANERSKTLNDWLGVANRIQDYATRGVNLYRARYYWTITVPEDDALYGTLKQWLHDRMPESKRREVTARLGGRSDRNPEFASDTIDLPKQKRRVHYYLADDVTTWINIHGHPIKVSTATQSDTPSGTGGTPAFTGTQFSKKERLTFTARNTAGRNAIEKFIQEVADSFEDGDRKPALRIADKRGGWSRRTDLPERTLDTIALPGNQAQELLDDLNGFLAAEDAYTRLGIPWHRGILLWGPPGTGKTSVVRAVATELGLDTHYIQLNDVSSNTDLIRLVNDVNPRSLVLLEDVDVLATTHDRDTTDAPEAGTEGITLDGLLNTLDGIATPHGLITVMTTNHRDKLDPALIRPGRIDVELEIGHLHVDQVRRLWEISFGDHPAINELDQVRADATPAEFVGAVKAHISDPVAAIKAVIEAVGVQEDKR